MFRENWGLPLTNDAPVTVTDTEGLQDDASSVAVVAAGDADPILEPPVKPARKRAPSCLLDA